jgi:hypothetical protein
VAVTFHRAAARRAADDALRGVAAAGDIDGQPRLVEELVPGCGCDQAGAEIGDRVAVLLVVAIDEARQEDAAPAPLRTVERQAVVVEQAVGAGAQHRIGRCLIPLERGGESGRRPVLWKAGQQRARPAQAAVEGLVDAQPGIAGLAAAVEPGQIDGPVVIAAADQVQRIAGRGCQRRLVLPLQERVATGPIRTRDHVDVAARDLRQQGRAGA